MVSGNLIVAAATVGVSAVAVTTSTVVSVWAIRTGRSDAKAAQGREDEIRLASQARENAIRQDERNYAASQARTESEDDLLRSIDLTLDEVDAAAIAVAYANELSVARAVWPHLAQLRRSLLKISPEKEALRNRLQDVYELARLADDATYVHPGVSAPAIVMGATDQGRKAIAAVLRNESLPPENDAFTHYVSAAHYAEYPTAGTSLPEFDLDQRGEGVTFNDARAFLQPSRDANLPFPRPPEVSE